MPTTPPQKNHSDKQPPKIKQQYREALAKRQQKTVGNSADSVSPDFTDSSASTAIDTPTTPPPQRQRIGTPSDAAEEKAAARVTVIPETPLKSRAEEAFSAVHRPNVPNAWKGEPSATSAFEKVAHIPNMGTAITFFTQLKKELYICQLNGQTL